MYCELLLVLVIIIELSISFEFLTSHPIYNRKCKHSIRMDDESPRLGIKTELTTRDEYLETRFKKLSLSGHDLTPFNNNDLDEWIQEYKHIYDNICNDNDDKFLGRNKKGIYVCYIGGLPLFASGFRIDKECDKKTLTFESPCDEDHIYTMNNKIFCVRSNLEIGSYEQGMYKIDAQKIKFLDLNQVWPVSSLPENFWGTEGQYVSWNSNDLSRQPLSY